MAKNLFSLTIFFVTFRETLEAAIIVAVLLGLVNQVVLGDLKGESKSPEWTSVQEKSDPMPITSKITSGEQVGPQEPILQAKLLRRMKLQILFGAGVGLLIAIAIGGAFIAVWFTQATNLWTKAEQLWEALRIFLVVMTNLILLVGAGLFSKAVWAFEENAFQQIVGASIDDTGGTGPGSYDVRGNVWHLDCCSPASGGWQIFNGVLGWQNSATLGSVLSYVFYWLAVIITLVYFKFKEGRTKLFGFESASGKRQREAREKNIVSDTDLDISTAKEGLQTHLHDSP
ncbi:hypothetical protein ID866_6556 [Astraeus odoratus]|nr:hypothetical protein ID866_6556 [Astraeus odoratus]